MAQPRRVQTQFLARLPSKERAAVLRAMKKFRVQWTCTPEQVHRAVLIHRTERIPLRLALEKGLGLERFPATTQRAKDFLTRLRERYTVSTKYGKVRIVPSFQARTSPASEKSRRGLQNFTWLAFRISPVPEAAPEFSKFLTTFKPTNPYTYAIIVEIGLATIGKNPVVVVTNTQAINQYYSLPWKLKKVFKGSYDKALEIIKEASGNSPVLIPSNAAVRGYIEAVFGHRVSDKILDEFYDRFSAKRGRRKTTLTIKNALADTKITAEFWV